jgi:hypothetical protein
MQTNLRGEVLTASSVSVKYVGKSLHKTTFSASGVAKGPYPGTFVATGSWGRGVSEGGPYWYFSESLNISSSEHRGGRDIPRRIFGNGGCSDLSCSGILTKTTFGPTSISVKLRLYRAGRFEHVEAPEHHAVKANLIKADSLKEWLQ